MRVKKIKIGYSFLTLLGYMLYLIIMDNIDKNDSINKIDQAKEFAKKKFEEIGVGNHYLEVYQILKDEFHVEDEEVLIAGLLHDTLEDTDTTPEEIEKTFSKKVADMVEEVSHPKNYSGAQIDEFYEKIKHISWGGKMIKLADFKSHLPKFIGAFTGWGDYKVKETNNKYVVSILNFLESCEDSEAKDIVFKLANELNDCITRSQTHL
jgi:guanosine-3',5'-bis(diphosphate) 3'-pyrophosphohydrolase